MAVPTKEVKPALVLIGSNKANTVVAGDPVSFNASAYNKNQLVNKIYEQTDFNEDLNKEGYVTTGSFNWKNGVKDSEVQFSPNKNGRFRLSWMPPVGMQNNIIVKKETKILDIQH